MQFQTLGGEGAEALAGDAFQTQLQPSGRTLGTETPHDGRGDGGADRPLGVVQRIGQFQRLAPIQEPHRILQHPRVQTVGDGLAPLVGPLAGGALVDLDQQGVQIEVVQV